MARRVPLETDLGNVRRHTAQVFEEFAARYVIYFAWGIGATGDHKAGKALDLMAYERGGGPNNPGRIRPGWNKTVAEYAWANRKRLGINYVIYDQLIQSNNPDGYAFGGWQDYPGESHANHVHISFEENPPAYRPPTSAQPPEDDMQLSDQLPVPQWLMDLYPADKGMADGKMTVQTALASGYAHSRVARDRVTQLAAYVHDHHADVLANVQQNEQRIAELAAKVDQLAAGVNVGALAQAVADAIDHDLDVEAVEQALRSVLGSLGETEQS